METIRGAMCRLALGLLVLGAAGLFAGPAAGQVGPFKATKTFAPPTILSGNPATLTIRLQNTDKTLAASAISFTDTFPAGMVLVPGNPTFQCGGTLVFSANAFTFTNGTVPAASFCDVLVTVTANSPTSITLTNVTSTISYFYAVGGGSIPGVTGALNVTGGLPPAITSPPPPGGQIGVAYDFAVTVFGTAPIATTVTGLPPGLSFSPATLHITGTPTTLGVFAGTISASNGFLPNAVQKFTISIQPPPLSIVTPPSSIAPPVLIGTPIDVTLQAVGGSPPYVWTVVGGALPPGVTLGRDGHLAGTPTAAGTYTFVVQVNDALGRSAIQTYILDIVKIASTLTVAVTPKPVVSGQTMTVAAAIASAGAVVATGTIDVYIAGTGMRCPLPFKFGDPASPVAPLRTAPVDATGHAQVAAPNLKIDDYGVCVRYSGDAIFNQAFAGPIDAYVIKGVLLPPPKVALSVPDNVASSAAIPVRVDVTSLESAAVPGGSVRILANGAPVATAALAGGVAYAMLSAPAAPGSMSLAAEYSGDGVFAPASSEPALILVNAPGGLPIPSLSDAALALLALLLAGVAAQRLRRRP